MKNNDDKREGPWCLFWCLLTAVGLGGGIILWILLLSLREARPSAVPPTHSTAAEEHPPASSASPPATKAPVFSEDGSRPFHGTEILRGLASHYGSHPASKPGYCAVPRHWRGSYVLVSRKGKTIRLKVNDYGPAIKGRVVDLHPSDFERLTGLPRSRGVAADVTVRRIP